MRKYLTVFLFVITINIYAENGLSLGVLGVGYSATNETDDGYYFGRVFSLYYQMDTGFGIDLSPLMFSIRMNDTINSSLTFVNFSLYYDILRKQEELVFAPFVSIHAINHDKLDFFEARCGLEFTLRLPMESFVFRELLTLELGYKYNRQQQGVYIHVGINLAAFLVYLGYGLGGNYILSSP